MKLYDDKGNLIHENHKNSHYSLYQILEERKIKKQREEKIKTSVISAILIATILAIAGIVWDSIKGGSL